MINTAIPEMPEIRRIIPARKINVAPDIFE